jgi:hypothetical protein
MMMSQLPGMAVACLPSLASIPSDFVRMFATIAQLIKLQTMLAENRFRVSQ